ncbi:MAG: DUF3793 family protein [Planctomycetes bacterium]|nr:DUF3793 family protein [Planctomycetota bacterium]
MLQSCAECLLAMRRRIAGLVGDEYLACLTAYHAAPVLCGLKPAALFCPDPRLANLRPDREMRGIVPGSLRADRFITQKNAWLVLVHAPERLAETLMCSDAVGLLRSLGYQLDFTEKRFLQSCFSGLRQRFAAVVMPHEIGVFLGYPARDVASFMQDGGCALASGGEWKSSCPDAAGRAASQAFRSAKLRAARLIASGVEPSQVALALNKGMDFSHAVNNCSDTKQSMQADTAHMVA